jgi:AcrR family transcriptional regulator
MPIAQPKGFCKPSSRCKPGTDPIDKLRSIADDPEFRFRFSPDATSGTCVTRPHSFFSKTHRDMADKSPIPTTRPRRRDAMQNAVAAPRQRRSQEGLAKMLQAGRDLIEASGNLEDLSITDIIERAGTSVGAFYRRFDNKDAFFDVVMDTVMAQGLDYVREAIAHEPAWQSSDAGAIADAVVLLHVKAFRRNRGLYHASLLRASQRKDSWDAVKQMNQDALTLMVPRLVAALVKERRGRAATPDALDFDVRAALQLVAGLLINSVLNDPGPLTLTSRRLVPWLQMSFRRCLALPDQ